MYAAGDHDAGCTLATTDSSTNIEGIKETDRTERAEQQHDYEDSNKVIDGASHKNR